MPGLSARREPREARAGFTMIELMMALIMAAIVIGAAVRVLNNNQRFYRSQGEVTELRENLRAIALMLPAELRELAPSQGDIFNMGDTVVSIRAMRVFGIVCAPPVKATGLISLRASQMSGYRAVDNTRDSALVFVDADSTKSSDDHWNRFGVSTIGTGLCTDGSAAKTYVLTGPTSSFDSTYVGAPVRFFERVRYQLYKDASNTWWLGTQSIVNGSWSGVTQVAGPLLANTGIKFTYYDSTGAVTATAANVTSIGITARGMSKNQINVVGRPAGYYYDSLLVRTAIRNH